MPEPLVFLPGMMSDARLFGPQIGALSSETAIMAAPITRGERIEEIASSLLDVLPARFALAGACMGGAVAMEIVRRAPDRVTRLALISTNALADTPQEAAAREPQIVRVRAGRLAEVMDEALPPDALAPGPAQRHVRELKREMAVSLGPETFVRQSRALQRRRDQQRMLSQSRMPILVMCGVHDPIRPVKRQRVMAELIPDAELCVLDKSGHVPTLEQPEAATKALRGWMQRPLMLHADFCSNEKEGRSATVRP
ncbi:MAG: alpha/beta fold hydrolase [Pseudomonadota bacterium]